MVPRSLEPTASVPRGWGVAMRGCGCRAAWLESLSRAVPQPQAAFDDRTFVGFVLDLTFGGSEWARIGAEEPPPPEARPLSPE
eukprot:scaffold19883_cov24-Phaeocystis_antarctica.AAC.1